MGNHANRIDRSNIHEWIERLYSPAAREALAAWEKEVQSAESSDGLTFRVALEDGVSRGRPYALARAFLAEVLVGYVENPEQSLETLSPLSAQLVVRLAAVTPKDGTARLLFCDGDFNSEPARKLASWSGPVPQMPALDFICRTLATTDEFAGFSMAAVLHALESNVKGLLETYADLGADFGRFALIDKDYSTHAESLRYAEHRGAHHVRVDGMGASASGRVEMLHRADEALRNIIATLPEPHGDGVLRPRVQILDDGGFLIRRLHQNPEFRPYAEYFTAVELTRKGIRDVRRMIAEEICARDLGEARALIAREANALGPEVRSEWAERSRGRLTTELRHVPAAAEQCFAAPQSGTAGLPDPSVLFVLQELLEVLGDDGVNRILSAFESQGQPVLGCAVGNLAEADVKLRAESSLVGYSIAVEADAAVQHLRASGLSGGQTAVVIGAGGANGRHVARDLAAMGYQVLAVDRATVPLPDHPNIHAASLEDALPRGDLVVSCAGERTLFEEHYPLLKDHAIVCQGASDDEELGVRDAHQWSTTAPTRTDRDGYVWTEIDGRFACTGHRNLSTHSTSTYRVNQTGHTVFFPNRGKVINFNGAADPIPARYIQVTRAAMLAMSVLARRSTAARLISMTQEIDRELIGVTERALGEESLFRPSWQATTPPLPTSAPAEITDPPVSPDRPPTHTIPMRVGLSDVESARLRAAEHPMDKYRLGPVARGSFEEIVLRRLHAPGNELRIEHAAADTAVGAFWGLFGAAGAHVSLSFATESHAPRYSNPGESLAMSGQPADRDGFAILLGGFLRHLLETHGAQILRHELPPAEIAQRLRDGFDLAGVEPSAFAAHLAASSDPHDRALAGEL